jgi:integrase
VKVLSELLELTTGESLNIESIDKFFNGWVTGRETIGRAEGTTKRYQGVIDSFLTHLGEKRGAASIASLSAAEIERWRNAELASGKGATTADFGVKILRIALNSARRKGLTLSNPAEAVDAAGGAAETRDPFPAEELASLLRVANDEWRGMILVGAWLGLRLADAAGLTWDGVDLAAGVLTFQPAKTRGKSAEPLRVAMHPELQVYFAKLPAGVGKAPLFPSLFGRKPGSQGGLSNEFSRLMEKAGVVVRKGRSKAIKGEKKTKGRQFNSKGFHSLRHTMISRFADAEVSSDVRRAMAGHSSDAMHRKYVHLSLDTQRAALLKLPAVAS